LKRRRSEALRIEERQGKYLLSMTEKELIDLRIDIVERVILKRKTGDPEHVYELYNVLCKVEV